MGLRLRFVAVGSFYELIYVLSLVDLSSTLFFLNACEKKMVKSCVNMSCFGVIHLAFW